MNVNGFEIPEPRFTPIKTNHIMGGVQHVFRFANGFGASVIQHELSHGGKSDLWELAVLRFYGDDEEGIFCPHPITKLGDGVIGWLKWDGDAEQTVEKILEQLEGEE